ncbi:carboxymuconolactone decarboxylase family protein [Caulobacter mirabilis]|uniref:Alkylhydroperoxidase n=1 Tax=Caulobacter mirabilis TaxID=69666 RepID=A0A2D2B0Q5_9CAUL|nr:carboxymuconolactone decarboxylase family protein [Caulobacter mirabilis]ATQ43841.1 alkylhydroperoxidase [Caulobacter mirabilis]
MQARMKNPAMLLPDAMQAILAVKASTEKGGVPQSTLDLVHLRASQINGCGPCIVGGARLARKAGETDDRIWAAAAWREAPFYTDAERAALALTEEITRLADRADAVPDAVWDEAARHFDERGLSAIVMMAGLTNLFNRINVATRQVAGAWG